MYAYKIAKKQWKYKCLLSRDVSLAVAGSRAGIEAHTSALMSNQSKGCQSQDLRCGGIMVSAGKLVFWQIKVWKSIRDSLHFNKKPFKNPYCCSSGCFCPAEKTDAHVWGCPLFTFMSTGVRPKTVLMCDWTLPSHLHTHMFTLPTYVDTQKLPDFLLWVHKVFFLSGPSFDLLTTDWR